MGAAVRTAEKVVGGGGKIIWRGVGFVWLLPSFFWFTAASDQLGTNVDEGQI